MSDRAETTEQPIRDVRGHDEGEDAPETAEDAANGANFPDANGANAQREQQGDNAEEQPKKPSIFKRAWAKLGIDPPLLIMMFKGSVAPTVAIAWYQSRDIVDIFTTIAYLVPILTVLCMPIMPRAKFLQTIALNLMGTCIGAAIAMLGIWSAIQARKHTTSPTAPLKLYNSSQSAVCAIWLFANIWFANSLRAKFPSFQFPVIIYSIFTNVAFTYGPIFLTVKMAESFVRQLLIAFLAAFAIATATNLFVFPVTCRTVVFKEQAGYIMAVRGTLKAQTQYLRSLETSDMFTGTTNNDGKDEQNGTQKKSAKAQSNPTQTPEALALKGAISGLTALHGKLHGDMVFAKREAAWGKLNAKDLEEIYSLFRNIIIPLIGMSTIADIFGRVAERRGWLKPENPTERDRAEEWEKADDNERITSQRVWNEVMKTLHEPFSTAVAAMDEGLQHAGLVLELLPKPKKTSTGDEEGKGTEPQPGDSGFAEYMDKKMVDFYNKRGETLREWARQKGLSVEQFNRVMEDLPDPQSPDEGKHQRDQQQLYLILFMEHLLYSTGRAIAALIRFADKKVEDGTMKKNRLILPSHKSLRKWILGKGDVDRSVDAESPDSLEAGTDIVYLGAGFNKRKDPEHLPPETAWQHFGNGIRKIPKFMASQECAFGFRVACATITIGIVAYLESTQTFFFKQRIVWAMIIVAIGMNMTSGQSIFGFLGRVAGTAIAMIASFIIWYIVDQKVPGVIVMLWLFIFLEMYMFLKYPRFVPIWLVTIVTQVLIIGYELEVRKLGIAAASANGQPYYPTYKLAPYRLACVAGGSLVSFIWTIFPYPLSDRSWLRRDLGSTLYLLANYYSVVHSTIRARVNDTEGDLALKTSPGRQLEKARHKIFARLLMILPSLKQHADWQKWEPNIGGKFPRDTYESIILRTTNLANYLSLMSYASISWTKSGTAAYPNADPTNARQWVEDLSALINSVNPTSHEITSILSLLSASVTQGMALPPYLHIPETFNLSKRLESLDRGILDARHIEDPGYSAYAVVHVASSLVIDDLARLRDHVKDLVGETDFSFKVSSDSDSESSSATPRQGRKGKAD